MTQLRHWVTALATAGLLASGCGGGSDESGVTTIGVLSAALADTAEASTYRVTMFLGTTMKLPAVGLDSTTDIDEQDPLLVGEVSRERGHYYLDLGPMLEGMGADLAEFGDLGFEMWLDDKRMVMDTSSYQQMAAAAPEMDLGPLAPGLFSIDLVAIGAESPQLLRALVGSSTPDLSELAVSLPSALREIEQTSTNPQIFVGTATYADLLAAQGEELTDIARTQAAGQALNQSMDIDSLTDFYVDFFESLEAEVAIELDERGLLRVFSTRVDMSGLFSTIFDHDDLIPGATEQERREAEESLKGAVMVFEYRMVYETDSNLEVPPPPAPTEDRTEEWRQFLINAGFGG